MQIRIPEQLHQIIANASRTCISDRDAEVHVLPVFVEWLGIVDSEGGVPAHKAEELWTNMNILFSRLSDASVVELLSLRDDFILLVMNELDPQNYMCDIVAWTSCCSVFLKCFNCCDNSLWTEATELAAQGMIQDIIGICLAPIAEKHQLGKTTMCFEVLSKLLTNAPFLWSHDDLSEFIRAITTTLSSCESFKEFHPKFVSILQQLMISAAQYARKNLVAATLLQAPHPMDNFQLFDRLFIEALCTLDYVETWKYLGIY